MVSSTVLTLIVIPAIYALVKQAGLPRTAVHTGVVGAGGVTATPAQEEAR